MSGWKDAYRHEGDVLTPCRGVALTSQMAIAKSVCAYELRAAFATNEIAAYLREKRDAIAYQSSQAIQMLRDCDIEIPKGSR